MSLYKLFSWTTGLCLALTALSASAQAPAPWQVINGTLESGDAQLGDGSFRDLHTFSGNAGETVTITLESPDFDVFLVLFDENDNPLANSDDIAGDNTNAWLTQVLPADGTYQVLVNSYTPSGQGRYTLKIYRGEAVIAPPSSSPETPELEAQQLMQRGFQDVAAGDASRGLAHLQQAEALFAQQDNAADRGLTLYGIGTAHDDLGQSPAAVVAYEQALGIFETIGDRQGQRNTLNNLAATYLDLGQTRAADRTLNQALTLARADNDRAAEADIWNNLGVTYDYLGQYGSALQAYQQALTLFRELGDTDRAAITLNNMGAINRNLGQYAKALEQYQQSFELRNAVGDPASMSVILNNIGEIHYLQGDLNTAEVNYQEALRLARESGDHAGEASVLNNLGQVAGARRHTEAELAYAQQALEITRERNRPLQVITALNNLGAVFQSQGQFTQAIAHYEEQLALAQQHEFSALAAAALSKRGSVHYQMGNLSAAQSDLFEAIAALESLRATELTDADKRVFYETQRTTYDLLQVVMVERGLAAAALEIAERGRAQAFAELLATDTPTPLFQTSLAFLKQTAQELNTTLVEYSLIGPELGTPWLYSWVISPTGQVIFQATNLEGKYEQLLADIRQTHWALGGGNRGGIQVVAAPDAMADRSSPPFAALYQVLIAPIAAALPPDPQARVTIIPQDELFLVPFAALTDEDDRYLIESHTLMTAPSIQSLTLTPPATRALLSNPLVVGNPTMPQFWDAHSGETRGLLGLPGAEAEAVEIAAMLNTQPLLGDAATETQVKQTITEASVVHLATHGLLDYGNPQASATDDLPGAIALAPDEIEDGLLTASELSRLTLQANLVVLSACDTGLGEISGDGVAGLSRSLLGAGAASVVASLWAVPDAPTAELMTEFYRQLQQAGQDKAQALRQAMLLTMETPNNADPRNWAAFTLIGTAD